MSRPAGTRGSEVTFDGEVGRLAGQLWLTSDAGRPLVVLAHGGGQTRHSWRRTAERLADGGSTVVTFDARGHGDSDWSSDGRYEFEDLAVDVAHVVRQARLRTGRDRVVLVGASMGGASSMMALAADPDLADALVLVDVTPKVEVAGIERIHRFVTAAPDGFEDLEAVGRAVSAYNPHRKNPGNLDGLRKNLRRRDNGRWYWHWDPAFFSSRPGATPQDLQEPLERAAGRITRPTLLVRGTASDIATEDGVGLLRTLIPQARVADVAGAGHMVTGDDNDVFAASLEEFLVEL
ncbi:pimeloyl-ACP methyl ester carboxylesterase [Nocardioides marinisabuli]|uniref:Pimeloyl-ACP methyl ester carboxylesterase n=1 Tax=Nocardioides marinisabuli TaxID=419476 RepID=A0A7Y9F3X7_9ACTN|nr:alpha/beta hydrolase [Nocardioides marinisabuli]NYD58936.1 pimeloyl-ACP methyl ester carboxylesterase [Nocardioides marinisabuli]